MNLSLSNTTGRPSPVVSSPFKLSSSSGIVPQGQRRQFPPVSRVAPARNVSKPRQRVVSEPEASGDAADVIAALIAMGENKAEANRLVKRAVANGKTAFQEIFVYCTVRGD